MNTITYTAAVICFIGATLSTNAAMAAKPLFTDETLVHAVLTAPLTQAYRDKKNDVRLYLQGALSYMDDNGASHKLDVKVRTRGNYRRANCAHPPLHLNFLKKANNNTLFEKQNKLKLVGPCKGGKSYQELLNLEYLVYQIWEEVSEFHFKTRLLELSYIDSDNRKKPWTSTTFVIEDELDLAKRYKRKKVELAKVKPQQLHRAQTALVELFQLFIGNTDYSTLAGPQETICCHNTRLIAYKNATQDIIPVPYDFDVSGFVNAPYATPAQQYPIKSVRQRYFSGWCKEERHFTSAIQRFNERKDRIYETVQNSGLLSPGMLRKTLKYMDSFYAQINDDERVQREIIGRCRGNVVSG